MGSILEPIKNAAKIISKSYGSEYISTKAAFSALTLLVRWQEGHPVCKKTEWWGAGVAIGLQQAAVLHMA